MGYKEEIREIPISQIIGYKVGKEFPDVYLVGTICEIANLNAGLIMMRTPGIEEESKRGILFFDQDEISRFSRVGQELLWRGNPVVEVHELLNNRFHIRYDEDRITSGMIDQVPVALGKAWSKKS